VHQVELQYEFDDQGNTIETVRPAPNGVGNGNYGGAAGIMVYDTHLKDHRPPKNGGFKKGEKAKLERQAREKRPGPDAEELERIKRRCTQSENKLDGLEDKLKKSKDTIKELKETIHNWEQGAKTLDVHLRIMMAFVSDHHRNDLFKKSVKDAYAGVCCT
jgi:uncharacterized coiled-coil protein SlyX